MFEVKNVGMHPTTKRLFDALTLLDPDQHEPEPGVVARLFGESPAVITNWKARGVSKRGVLTAHHKFGINPAWITTGIEPIVLPTGAGSGGATTLQLTAHTGHNVTTISDEESLNGDYLQIRESEVRFSAGGGRAAQFDEISDSVPATYRREWFSKEGINPTYARRFKVHGDSMEPFLYDSDTVLVNLAETSIINGKVYAMRYGDELRIKRVYKTLSGGLILHSDNPEFLPRDEDVQPAVVEEHITIIGRVRDKSGTGGL